MDTDNLSESFLATQSLNIIILTFYGRNLELQIESSSNN